MEIILWQLTLVFVMTVGKQLELLTSRGIFPGDLKSYPNGKLTQGNRPSSGASDGSRLENRENQGHPRLMCPNRRYEPPNLVVFSTFCRLNHSHQSKLDSMRG